MGAPPCRGGGLRRLRRPSGERDGQRPGNRTTHEVDLAVFTTGDEGTETLLAVGETKLGETPGKAHLERLEHIRGLLSSRFDTSRTKLALFSGSGFSASLKAIADREDLVLVGLADLYGDSV
ncbi:hypothetical protein GCM10029992_07410 [Glycomyces albus]